MKKQLFISALTALLLISCDSLESKKGSDLKDYLGYWDCSAYNINKGETEEAYNLIIEEYEWDSKPGIIVRGFIYGETSYSHIALGRYNEKNHVLDLYGDWYNVDNIFYYASAPDTHYYSVFRVTYYNPSEREYYYLDDKNGDPIASLRMNQDGSLTLVRGPYADSEGRFANGFVFDEYNKDTDEYYQSTSAYYRVNFTRASNPPLTKSESAEFPTSACLKKTR